VAAVKPDHPSCISAGLGRGMEPAELVVTGAGTGSGGLACKEQSTNGVEAANAANAALWAEFERRRRADRQQRRQRSSEVQQLLLEVQKERSTGITESTASASPAMWRTPMTMSSSKRVSEVQLLLAEVQQERLRASPQGKAPKLPLGDPAPLPIARRTTPSPRQLSFEATALTSTPPPKSRSRSSTARLQRSASPQRSKSSPPPRVPRARSSTPKRMHQLGAVAGDALARDWALRLRQPAAARVENEVQGASKYSILEKPSLAAYPAGGWDDRVSCPPTFTGPSRGGGRSKDEPVVRKGGHGGAAGVGRPQRPWDGRTSCPNPTQGFAGFLDCRGPSRSLGLTLGAAPGPTDLAASSTTVVPTAGLGAGLGLAQAAAPSPADAIVVPSAGADAGLGLAPGASPGPTDLAVGSASLVSSTSAGAGDDALPVKSVLIS